MAATRLILRGSSFDIARCHIASAYGKAAQCGSLTKSLLHFRYRKRLLLTDCLVCRDILRSHDSEHEIVLVASEKASPQPADLDIFGSASIVEA